jgi:hypothetical protein
MQRMRDFNKKPVQEKEQQSEEPHTSLEQVKEQLKAFLYDDSLVDEFADSFLAVKDAESLSKIMEVLQAKESEITNLVEHKEAFKPESDPDAKKADKQPEQEIDYVDQILSTKYGVTK